MSQGIYGTRVASLIDPTSDVDIFYSYRSSRSLENEEASTFKKLPDGILSITKCEKDDTMIDNVMEGVYNLKLPMQYFGTKGYYSVYIKPKEIYATISDVGVLSSYPDIKGIVLDTTTFDSSERNIFSTNNSLTGYRIVYFDINGNREDYYRIVTSNNKCEPVIQNTSDTNDKSVRYRYNDNSTTTFITVTPSTASSLKSSSTPYIGEPSKRVAFVNTKFEPILLDIEMADHDIETISTVLEGSQVRDLENGLITTFNSNNEIYSQSEHYTVKSTYTNTPQYEVKKNKSSNIDFTQTIEDKE